MSSIVERRAALKAAQSASIRSALIASQMQESLVRFFNEIGEFGEDVCLRIQDESERYPLGQFLLARKLSPEFDSAPPT